MTPEPETPEEAEEFRAYPKSVQPGIPTLGAVPAEWQQMPMGDLLTVVQRPAIMVDDHSYELVTARRNRGGIVSRGRLTGKQIATKTQFWVKPGDFVMSRRQIAHGACGVLPKALDGALVSNEYAALLPTAKLDRGYLRHLPHSIYFQQTCFHSSIGVHVEKLVFNLNHWLTWPFLVPPLPEQRRIAAVLDTWDTAIVTSEKLLSSLRQRKSILSANLMKMASNSQILLGTLGRLEKGRGLAKTDLTESGIPCLRYAEIYTRYGDTTRSLSSHTSESGARSSKPLKYGDIVFAASGETAEEIGKALAYLGEDRAVVGGDTVVLTEHGQDPAFLARVLNSEDIIRQKAALGKGHSVVHIHAPDLARLLVPLPPIPEQQRIAAMLELVEDEVNELQVLCVSLSHQKRGLMQQLLTGKLRVPESLDSLMPATALEAAA